MCGIIGYTGGRSARELVLAGLERLEVRGYDSAGVCLHDGASLQRTRAVGGPATLAQAVPANDATCGLGHTRWATHGAVCEENAHPFCGCAEGEPSIVLNGIVENFQELRSALKERGHRMRSTTDAEVVAHLVEEHYAGDLATALTASAACLEGQFAILAVHREHPGVLVGTRSGAPLLVGCGVGESFVGSSLAAFGADVESFLSLEDGETVTIRAAGEPQITAEDGTRVLRAPSTIDFGFDVAPLAGFTTYMQQEIHEQPAAVEATLRGRLEPGALLGELGNAALASKEIRQVVVIGCGTSLNAGLAAKPMFERWSGLPTSVEPASEWRHAEPFVGPETLVIAISQSGETADTLGALRLANRRGAVTLAVTNADHSQITREASATLLTRAGHESSVAATKTFTAQLVALACLALRLGEDRGQLAPAELATIADELRELPGLLRRSLRGYSPVQEIAARFVDAPFFLYLGRGAGVATCQEGALKLREVAYLPAECYPAGEMKHGPIALIEQGTPVVCVATDGPVLEKLISNIHEIRARGAHVIAIASEGNEDLQHLVDDVIYVPATSPALAPVTSIVPLQELAYHVASARGLDVDRPRNLAKTVTVE